MQNMKKISAHLALEMIKEIFNFTYENVTNNNNN